MTFALFRTVQVDVGHPGATLQNSRQCRMASTYTTLDTPEPFRKTRDNATRH